MKLLKINKNKMTVALALGLVFSVLLSFARFDALCDDLRTNVLRLHILANSDSESDQQLKLKVRDAIIEQCGYVFEDNTTLSQAVESVNENLSVFSAVAKNVVRQNGYDYDVSVELGDSYFDTRVYDDFTLPAGVYEALKVKIGAAQGKNWWCVMFPSVCVYSAADKNSLSSADNTDKKDAEDDANRLEYSTSKESAYVAEHSEKYVIKFKVVEIYEKIKKYFSK